MARTRSQTSSKRHGSAGTRAHNKVGKTVIEELQDHYERLDGLTRRRLNYNLDVKSQFKDFLEELRTLARNFQSKTMTNVRTTAEEHEQDERKIERESWQEVVTQFWAFANSLIQLVPLFRKGLTKKGLSYQFMWNALVIIVIVFCAVMAVLIFSAGLEVVCLVRGQESCAALGFHRRALTAVGVANHQTCAAATVTAGALGYHGPFGDVIVAAMPGDAPVARGFWTQPMPRGEAGASAFCMSAVAAIEVGQNNGNMPTLHTDADNTIKNCQRCVQEEAGPFTPSKIMNCLAPLQFRGYNL
jgi:hypothetical protein